MKEQIKVYHEFKATPEGQKLYKSPRWGKFKPAHVNLHQWENLLGADVNNMKHMLLTAILTGLAIPEVGVSKAEGEILLWTAITHDWAEAIVGDIPLYDKTASAEQREHAILRKMLEDRLPKQANGIMDVIGDVESKLGKIFQGIEYVGYVRTQRKAGEMAHKVRDEELQDNLMAMSRTNIERNTKMAYARLPVCTVEGLFKS